MTSAPHNAPVTTPYDESFYQRHQDGSANSAQVVVPLVLSLFPCHSVVDVGCGVGGWLKAFERRGVSDYLGVDGDYVSRDQLKIPASHFRPVDLRSKRSNANQNPASASRDLPRRSRVYFGVNSRIRKPGCQWVVASGEDG